MSWHSFKQTYLVKFWSPVPAVIAAGILSTYYFGITGTFWAVTGEFTRWGGQLLQLAGVHAEEWGYFKLIHLEGSPLTRIDGMMIIGMFGGCFAAALWANNVKLRMPKSRIRIMQAVVGGIIAGFGARLAMGCNLAAFFTGIPQFSLHAWFFAVATLEALPQLKKGEILEVVSDCPQSINNIPLDAKNHGYTVLDIQQDGPTIRYLIQK